MRGLLGAQILFHGVYINAGRLSGDWHLHLELIGCRVTFSAPTPLPCARFILSSSLG